MPCCGSGLSRCQQTVPCPLADPLSAVDLHLALNPCLPACGWHFRAAEWLGMIAEARSERDALAAGKAAAEHRAAELEGQLSAAMSDLESAKVRCLVGTAVRMHVPAVWELCRGTRKS